MSQTQQQQQLNKVIVPPMRYRLSKLTQEETLIQIGNLTRGFYDLPVEVATWIQNDVRSREFSSFGYIPAPPDAELVKQIIGLDGCYFKLTTSTHRVDFIWHDRAKNEFQFLGEYQCCIRAMNAIRYRICKYVDGARAKAMASAKAQAQASLDNVQPHPAVCYEASFCIEANGDVHVLASKHFPEMELI